MRAVWRLCINGLAGRRSRTALLVLAVALSTALVAAVSCALSSLNNSVQRQVSDAIGRADIRIRHLRDEPFDAAAIDVVRADPRVLVASGRNAVSLNLSGPSGGEPQVVIGVGLELESHRRIADPRMSVGRAIERDNEVTLPEALAASLGAPVGATVQARLGARTVPLTVVGTMASLPFKAWGKPEVFVSSATLEAVSGISGRYTEIHAMLRDDADPEAAAAELQGRLPADMVVSPTALVTSGIDSTLRANNFSYILALVLAYLSAAFIVLTGLTTRVVERQRELAILRCIGATRPQLAVSQLGVGALIGALGALLGVPLGVGLAWIMSVVFRDNLPAGLHLDAGNLALAGAGAIIAGLLGAAWPAATASRTTPLRALASHARPIPARAVPLVTAAGFAGIALQVLSITLPPTGQAKFWAYAVMGLPMMFVGWFLLSVPMCLLLARALGPVLSRVLKLPPGLLQRSLAATPFRNGFTSGSLMVGLAMMTVVWTHGSTILRDWIDSIEFPDAFVNAWLGVSEESRRNIDALPFVSDTCAISLVKAEDETFGVRSLRPLKTTFIAFEPEPFFAMTTVHWVAGDRDYALRRLQEGGAVLVAKEFLIARGDLYGVGKTYPLRVRGRQVDMEIVGVVASPGLDIVSKYFDIGQEYAEQAIHSVFGTRADLKKHFGDDKVELLQIGLQGDISDEEAVKQIRAALGATAAVVGSGREIKESILDIGRGTMTVASVVALAAILIGCASVGNIVIAGIDARRFEFGVLRAIGAQRGVIARLLLAEVLVIALGACLIGTMMGLQGSAAGIVLYRAIIGLELGFRPAWGAIAAGWGILVVAALAAGAPIILKLAHERPRELLAATRG